ncbi:MAG: hypothetical protein LBG64_04230 [Pseudomonadales bacterium]|jgi:uncharacterized membrane protein|nr:hypothetical protein [Pseudomonadales bacterium]
MDPNAHNPHEQPHVDQQAPQQHAQPAQHHDAHQQQAPQGQPQDSAQGQAPGQDQQAPAAGDSSNKGMAALSYIGLLFIIPMVTNSKNDPFVKFHIKQGIVLFISYIVAWIASIVISMILGNIPIMGGIMSFLISTGIWIFYIVLIIKGIVNATGGKTKELPVVGGFASKLNF